VTHAIMSSVPAPMPSSPATPAGVAIEARLGARPKYVVGS